MELTKNIEYLNFNEVFEIKTGKGITSKDAESDAEYPIISGGIEPMGYYKDYNRDENTVTISRVGANAGFVNFIDKKFYLNDKCFSIIPKKEYKNIINSKYVYYYTKSIESNIRNLQSEGGVPTINTQKVGGLIIPIPSLETQNEIVYMLDRFTMLIEELKTELTARRKQYDFYKNELLNKQGNVYLLDEICNFKTGNKPKEIIEKYENGLFEYINAGTTNSGYTDESNFKGDIVTTPSRGQGGIGFVGYQEKDFWLGPLCYGIWAKDQSVVLNKYIYYELSYKKDEILKRKNTGGVPSLNGSDLKTIPINVPSIDEQKRIVEILDYFQKITESVEEGIPAEIEKRQKQYEYYRDKLLSFKEVEVNE